eukprot:Skav211043  [mRNA]  locus=scaffold1434:280706:298513:- [translate_table: standard]
MASGAGEIPAGSLAAGDEPNDGAAKASLCGSEATLEGWASVRGDGLQLGLEESLQLPLHNGLEESISSLCRLMATGYVLGLDRCEGTFSGRRPKRPSHAVQVPNDEYVVLAEDERLARFSQQCSAEVFLPEDEEIPEGWALQSAVVLLLHGEVSPLHGWPQDPQRMRLCEKLAMATIQAQPRNLTGNGEVCMYSLPKDAFDDKPLSRALLMARFKPAWVAAPAPPGAEPKGVWERHLQCAAARADQRDPCGVTVAAGSEKAVVLIWRLKSKGALETAPCEVLRPNLQDADTVVSLAWCPADEELLVAGLASGFVVLWGSNMLAFMLEVPWPWEGGQPLPAVLTKDLAVPMVPLRAFMPGSRMPMQKISWNDATTLCVPSECVCIDLRDERQSQFRSFRGKTGKHLIRCMDMCHSPTGVLSAWSDGAVHLKRRELLNFSQHFRKTKAGRAAQILGGLHYGLFDAHV